MPSDPITKVRSDGSEPGADSISLRGRSDLMSLMAAAGAGAAAMYLLDPDRGRRRRALIRDKAVHAAHVASDAAGTTKRDVANHARGLAAVARRRFSADERNDSIIVERVRAELGRVVSHPGSIAVSASRGIVTLSGPVLADEAGKLLAEIRDVRGVEDVVDQLTRHEDGSNVPGLQGGSPREARPEILQENWTPAMRLASAVAGGALAASTLGGQRRNPLMAALGLAGAALLARAVTNRPFSRMLVSEPPATVPRRSDTVEREVDIERVRLDDGAGAEQGDGATPYAEPSNTPPAAW